MNEQERETHHLTIQRALDENDRAWVTAEDDEERKKIQLIRSCMNALLTLMDFAEPRRSTLAPHLMMVTRWLYAKGRLRDAGRMERYIFYQVAGEFVPDGGRAITNNLVDLALVRSLTPMLPPSSRNQRRSHGTARIVTQPVHRLPDPSDESQDMIMPDPCCEFQLRSYSRGALHGPSIKIHTCVNETFVQSVSMTEYVDGLISNRAYQISRATPDSAQVEVRAYAITVNGGHSYMYLSRMLPLPVSDAWLSALDSADDDDIAALTSLTSTYIANPNVRDAISRVIGGVPAAVLASLPPEAWLDQQQSE